MHGSRGLPTMARRGRDLPPSLGPVAELIPAGFSDQEIAKRTGLSLASARASVSRVYRRLGVHGRGELLRKALRGRRERDRARVRARVPQRGPRR